MDASWVNAVFNGVMALIWLAYLNLFLREFKSRNRARLFIQLHGGYDLDAACRLINMSDKPVSVSCVQLYLQLDDGGWTVEVTDREMEPVRQGKHSLPAALQSAESVALGTFRELLATGVRKRTGRDEPLREALKNLQKFEVRLVVQHGASDHPGAVQRAFAVEQNADGWGVVPEGPTRLSYSRRGRRLADQWMRTDVDLRGSGAARLQAARSGYERTTES